MKLNSVKWSVALVGLFASAANAEGYNAGINLRSEMGQETVKPETGDSTSTMGFKFREARFVFKGQAAQRTNFMMRLRFDRDPVCSTVTGGGAACTTKTATGQSRNLDIAYVEQMATDQVSVKFGRQSAGTGGVYGNQEAVDQYHLISKPAAYNSFDRVDGVSFGYTPMEKTTVSLMFFNPRETDAEGESFANKGGLGLGLTFKGEFVDGLVRPILSYHTTPKAEDKTAGLDKGADTYLFAGVQVVQGDIAGSLDYASMKTGKQSSAGKDLTATGMGLSASYRLGCMRPLLKYWSDAPQVVENGSVKTGNKTTQMALAVEFMPENAAGNYFVAFRTKDVEKTAKTTAFLVGFALDASAAIPVAAATN